ncbi:MAG: hypothetical protein CMN60_20180 [Sphingobium sp.]|nr:hypothetical protein [Sphingobium sp.]|tara:strand:- start:2253 stop:2504 length:252 start_codon:yes stop_codon:yes gene_type:complete
MDNDDNTYDGSLVANLIDTSTLSIEGRSLWDNALAPQAEVITAESDEIKALRLLLEAIDMLPDDNELKQTLNSLRASIKLQGE